MTPRTAAPKPKVPVTLNGEQIGTAVIDEKDGTAEVTITDPNAARAINGDTPPISVYADVKRLSEPATDPEAPEPEPLPDTPEHRSFRQTQEFVVGLGFNPRQVTNMTIDWNGVRVFHRNAEGRNLAKMIRFGEIPDEHRQRIIAEAIGE